jgi:predicted MPP superfamily phosphohydrolase
LYESQWVELRRVEVPVAALPPDLDRFRILHLSDFHLGIPSLGARALRKAIAWAAADVFDLVAVTGDLVSHRRGEPALREALTRLRSRYGTFAVLGNHDIAETRDPFSAATELADLDAAGATLLRNESRLLEVGRRRVQLVGCEPRAAIQGRAQPWQLLDPRADLRILLCHFPDVFVRLPPDAFQLVLAGHLHGGQICFPLPGGERLRFAHLDTRFAEGIFRREATTMVVSRGLGTTFVPFRFFARPEAAELILRAES